MSHVIRIRGATLSQDGLISLPGVSSQWIYNDGVYCYAITQGHPDHTGWPSFGRIYQIQIGTPLPPPVPEIPIALEATDVTHQSFQANWSPADRATSYRLDVATDIDFSVFVPGFEDLDVGENLSTFVGGLFPDTDYFYRVRAVNVMGRSDNSNVIQVTTLSPLQMLCVTFI